MQNKLTKVICTIGPASEEEGIINQMYLAGMNVARLNFKHGDYDWFRRVMNSVRKVSANHGEPIAILQDLQGPDIRTGRLHGGEPIKLRAGDPFFLSADKRVGDHNGVSVSLTQLDRHLAEGDRVLIDDGKIEMIVKTVSHKVAHCEITNGGKLGERKGINIPGKRPQVQPLNAKDRHDVAFALKEGVDFIALSFVQSAKDVHALRRLIKKLDPKAAEYIQVISKVESVAGIENFEEILEASDGIMIARGDLGIELPLEEIPAIQKELIQKCNKVGKPVITATQMLDSMQDNPIPTRAEASDVANAVLDNTDALMLSAESASGKYAVQAVLTMSKIIKHTEGKINSGHLIPHRVDEAPVTIRDSVAKSACDLAQSIGARYIMTLTTKGNSARDAARFRPSVPIIAATPYDHIHRQLLLVNNILPHCIYVAPHKNFKAMLDEAIDKLTKFKKLERGDRIVVTAGIRGADEPGRTNLAMVHTVE